MTKFEEDFEQMEIAFDEDKLELYDHLKANFIEKYDPEKQNSDKIPEGLDISRIIFDVSKVTIERNLGSGRH